MAGVKGSAPAEASQGGPDAAGATPAGATPAGRQDWRAGVRSSGRNQLVVLLVTALLVGLGAWLLGGRTGSSKGEAGSSQAVQVTGDKAGPPPEVGKPAQDFTARTVDGRTLKLSALRGKPVWLTFGASWCTACRAEAPDIQTAYAQASKASGLEVVSVSMQEMPADVQVYASRLGLTFPQIADPETALASRYRVMALPSHFFLDKDGVIRSIHVGGLTRPAMDEEIAKVAG